MKLVRFGPSGEEKPGIVDDGGVIRDLSSLTRDHSGEALSESALEKLSRADFRSFPSAPEGSRLGPCVGDVGKFICIGLNYADHAAETNAKVPDEPIIFMKATSAITGPNDNIIKPKHSTKLDWEVELGVVIGREARYVDQDKAAHHIAGYCVINDISERAFQLERGGQWTKGKGCDSFGPIGPWLVTKDEVADPQDLSMFLEVNGKKYQDGSTSTMVFGPSFLVSYLSQFMSLQPGDIISTGTPPGVGLGQKPPVYLSAGDVMTLGIEGLGEQRQTVIDYKEAGT